MRLRNGQLMPRARRRVAAVTCLLLLASSISLAQQTGRLAGVMRDETGGALSGVTVTATGDCVATPLTVITDEHGRYVIQPLSPGHCQIAAGLIGFDSRVATIEITAGEHTLDLLLPIRAMSESVTVTTTKAGAADVQSTPVAITVLPATTLDHMGIRAIEGLAGMVPAVTISQANDLAQVTIRGIGTNSTVVGADPSSAVYLDGVYLSRPSMIGVDLVDVERIEVLRGPQGTLYGRNAVGGTINIVTRQPTNALESSARMTVGDYHEVRTEGVVSGPLIRNKLMAGVALLGGRRDGFVTDLDHPGHPLGSKDTLAGRGHLRFLFGPRTELLLAADYGRFNGVPLTNAKPLVAKPPFSFDNPARFWSVRASELASGGNIQQGASGRLVAPLSRTITLTSLTAYRKSDSGFFVDGDSTELIVGATDVPDLQHQSSHETTVAGRTEKLTWVGGVFFYDEHNEAHVEITSYLSGTQIRPFAMIDTRARALFGQATLRVSGRVSVTGGVRYIDEHKDLDSTGGVYQMDTDRLAVPASFYDFAESASFRAWTPKGGIQVQAARDTFGYFSATKGYKSGGFNPGEAVPAKAPFGPEFAWSYEGGLKRTMAHGRIRTNTAAYYTNYRDQQVLSFQRPGVPEINNAGAATIRGAEIELAGAVAPSLRLAGHVSWLDAKYDHYFAHVLGSAATLDAAGNRLNNAPEWSGSGSVVWQRAAGGRGTISVRGDASWQNQVFFEPFNGPIETQRPYGLLHLRAGFEARNRRWELAVFLRNLSNQAYITSTSNVPLTAYVSRPGDPRQWRTQLTLRR
jgi:iron complex outermembrane receptor protein